MILFEIMEKIVELITVANLGEETWHIVLMQDLMNSSLN